MIIPKRPTTHPHPPPKFSMDAESVKSVDEQKNGIARLYYYLDLRSSLYETFRSKAGWQGQIFKPHISLSM